MRGWSRCEVREGIFLTARICRSEISHHHQSLCTYLCDYGHGGHRRTCTGCTPTAGLRASPTTLRLPRSRSKRESISWLTSHEGSRGRVTQDWIGVGSSGSSFALGKNWSCPWCFPRRYQPPVSSGQTQCGGGSSLHAKILVHHSIFAGMPRHA